MVTRLAFKAFFFFFIKSFNFRALTKATLNAHDFDITATTLLFPGDQPKRFWVLSYCQVLPGRLTLSCWLSPTSHQARPPKSKPHTSTVRIDKPPQMSFSVFLPHRSVPSHPIRLPSVWIVLEWVTGPHRRGEHWQHGDWPVTGKSFPCLANRCVDRARLYNSMKMWMLRAY